MHVQAAMDEGLSSGPEGQPRAMPAAPIEDVAALALPPVLFAVSFSSPSSPSVVSAAAPVPAVSACAEGSGEPLCIVCCHRPRVCVLLPCKHFKLCMECAERLDTCPLCRANIAQRMELFI